MTKKDYEMTAAIIRKVQRYDAGEVEGAASENQRGHQWQSESIYEACGE